MKKITQIAFAFAVVLLLVSCKNTKQKIQEHVSNYNTSSSIKGGNVVSTSAKAFLNDNKIELRFETDLKQNETNKTEAVKRFPEFLKEMINKDLNFKELVEEGVQFDVYFLADDNTVLAKQIINKEELTELLKK